MNRETLMIYDFIQSSGYHLDRIYKLRSEYKNSKDFTFRFKYEIMSIINIEKRFLNMSRKQIDLDNLASLYF